MPVVANTMNNARKVVFSRTLEGAEWNNSQLLKDELPGNVRRLKEEAGPDIVIFGSGTIVTQLAQEDLIDEYVFVIVPVVQATFRVVDDFGASHRGEGGFGSTGIASACPNPAARRHS